MLSKLRVQHYKSLFDTTIHLEPLTVLTGFNGSGKSNILEALVVLSNFLKNLMAKGDDWVSSKDAFLQSLLAGNRPESTFWRGELDFLSFEVNTFLEENRDGPDLGVRFNYPEQRFIVRLSREDGLYRPTCPTPYRDSLVADALKKVSICNFGNEKTEQDIASVLVDILHSDRGRFDELEKHLTYLIPSIKRIALPRAGDQGFSIGLIEKYSDHHHISATDASNGVLKILSLLATLYQKDTPSVICLDGIENGIHPWLLCDIAELLKLVSTKGIAGKPVQVLLATHSPVLLSYFEPYQIRVVKLDSEGKTDVSPATPEYFQMFCEICADKNGLKHPLTAL